MKEAILFCLIIVIVLLLIAVFASVADYAINIYRQNRSDSILQEYATETSSAHYFHAQLTAIATEIP